ncbi:GntR family transcriptional regulator [Pseudoroseomonas wenyumeiae]
MAEKMLERRPGVGTFVCATAPLGSTVLNFSDVFSHLKEMGRCTEVRLLSFGYAVPAPPVAAALGLTPGEKAQRAVRVRMIGDAPFSYLTTHVPEQVGQTYSEADLARQPLLALLERSGVVIGRARQSISATLAGPDVAGLLQLEIGAPLLSLTRVVEDEAGRAVEHLHALYRPDRFTFEMQLQRTGAQGARRWSPLPPRRQPRRQQQAKTPDQCGHCATRGTLHDRSDFPPCRIGRRRRSGRPGHAAHPAGAAGRGEARHPAAPDRGAGTGRRTGPHRRRGRGGSHQQGRRHPGPGRRQAGTGRG